MKIFLGFIVDNNGSIVHSHIAESPDETFYVEVYNEKGKLLISDEFRKWYHLENVIERNELNLYPISMFKNVTTTEMIDFLTFKEDANIF